MLAIGGDHRVGWRQRLHRTDGDRLLADVEMQEPADLLPLIKLGAFLLEAPDAEHLRAAVSSKCSRVRCGFGAWVSLMTSLSKRRQVALGQAKFAGLQQAAHDLAAARLGQVGAEVDLLGRDRGAEALARVAEELACAGPRPAT